jgi:DNA-binding LacI/PurR family transcriptional regulator
MSPPPRSPRVTASDVAARAGVSQPTVSLVLGGREDVRVAAATRERVLRAAEELGYRPNLVARGLVLRRSFAIGVVVPDLGNPFFLDVVRGVERVAAEGGYAVLLCDGKEVPAAVHVETLLTRQVDGVVLDPQSLAALPASTLAGLNVVVIEDQPAHLAWVASDAAGAGRAAAEHLLSLGHTAIAMAGPAAALHGFRMRERGFVQALGSAGVRLPSDLLRRVPATVEGGQMAMRSLLSLPARPTAVFGINDLVALGMLKVCLSGGVAVPGALSIIGCDDIAMARVVTPELTTVAVPAREIGARAARLMLNRLGDRDAPRPAQRPLAVRLVVRQTTAPVRGADE